VLAATALPAALREALGARYRLIEAREGMLAACAQALPGADRQGLRAIVTMGSLALDANSFSAFPALGLVCCIGSGYEGVDLAAARARGIVVAHSPAANAGSVAEVALGLAIASVRGFRAEALRLASGEWGGNAMTRTVPRRGLAGRRLGVYGMGAIGTEIVARARPFGMEIGYHNRTPRADSADRWFPSLIDLAHWCDLLVVAVRASAATRHAVDANVLAALGADGHVVNIARGNVIDETALIAALANGTIAGAGLDVYEHEPHVPAELAALPNVVALPHIGGASRDAQQAMQTMVLANLDAYFAGRPVPTPVPA
jgi:lactate dehydrogenase-like 2-hydroxyacid dehydrogenase